MMRQMRCTWAAPYSVRWPTPSTCNTTRTNVRRWWACCADHSRRATFGIARTLTPLPSATVPSHRCRATAVEPPLSSHHCQATQPSHTVAPMAEPMHAALIQLLWRRSRHRQQQLKHVPMRATYRSVWGGPRRQATERAQIKARDTWVL